MKRTAVSTCVMIVVLFTANIALSQSNSDYKSKIESINKEMAKNMVEGNAEKLLALYTEDAISMPSYQPIHDGIAVIRKASDEMAKSGVKYNSFTPTTLKVMANGNLITEIGTYKISMSMPNMNNPMDDHGKYLTIWEKQKDGSLKVKVEIWNSDVDPMSMMNQMGQKSTDKK
jgi:ketosteroid isomerase-like protein